MIVKLPAIVIVLRTLQLEKADGPNDSRSFGNFTEGKREQRENE